jgi:predicted  nucleic acid-binding Zn-ribbon protein
VSKIQEDLTVERESRHRAEKRCNTLQKESKDLEDVSRELQDELDDLEEQSSGASA